MPPMSAAWPWCSLACAISVIDRPVLKFDQLGLTPALLRAMGEMGLFAPTPIQAEAIPAVLKSADVWACLLYTSDAADE